MRDNEHVHVPGALCSQARFVSAQVTTPTLEIQRRVVDWVGKETVAKPATGCGKGLHGSAGALIYAACVMRAVLHPRRRHQSRPLAGHGLVPAVAGHEGPGKTIRPRLIAALGNSCVRHGQTPFCAGRRRMGKEGTSCWRDCRTRHTPLNIGLLGVRDVRMTARSCQKLPQEVRPLALAGRRWLLPCDL